MTIFDRNIPNGINNTFEDIRDIFANDKEYEMVIERTDMVNNKNRKF